MASLALRRDPRMDPGQTLTPVPMQPTLPDPVIEDRRRALAMEDDRLAVLARRNALLRWRGLGGDPSVH